VVLLGDAECNGETDFDNDEGELDPEAVPQDGVLTEVDAEALVFPTDEDGAYYVAANKDAQEDLVQMGMAKCVEDGEENQTSSTSDSKDDGEDGIEFLPDGGVGRKFTRVTEIALENEGKVKGNYCYSRHSNEEGLKAYDMRLASAVRWQSLETGQMLGESPIRACVI